MELELEFPINILKINFVIKNKITVFALLKNFILSTNLQMKIKIEIKWKQE